MVKWLAVVSMSCALVALMMVLLVIFTGHENQTQTFMTVLYAICLVGLFVCVVMVWKARYLVNTMYVVPHNHFQQAVTNNCITNAKWANMLAQWNTHTSFGNFGG